MSRCNARRCAVAAFTLCTALVGGSAHAALYPFSYVGNIGPEHFFAYPSDATAAGVVAGDPLTLKFNLDTSVANTGTGAMQNFPGAVKNIELSFPTRGLTYSPTNATFQLYPFANGPAYYRWDVTLPTTDDSSPFAMSFWFRETDYNLPYGIPSSIDPNQFGYEHDVSIYHGNPFGGGAEAFYADLSVAPTVTPEPATAAIVIAGALGAMHRRRRA